MDIKNTVRNFVSFITAACVAVAPTVLYVFLLRRRTAGALMYSGGALLSIAFLSVICAGVLWLILKKPLYEKQTDDCEESQGYEDLSESAEPFESEEASSAREAYPELFERRENKDEVQSAPSFYDALTKAIGEQKAEFVPEDEEKDEPFDYDDSFFIKTEKEKPIPDIYDSIPDTLPEGYTVSYEEEYDEDEDGEYDEQKSAENETKRRYSFGETIASKALAALASLMILTAASVLLSQSFTVYSADGISVTSFGREKTYGWEDCRMYEISPSVLGDRLSVKLYMSDGAEIQLLPSDLSFSEEFEKSFGTVYSYALHASERMTASGAQKTVKERNTIESEFINREIIGEDIKKLIE